MCGFYWATLYIEYWFRVWLLINRNSFKLFDLKLNYTRSQAVATIADRTVKNCTVT